MDDKIIPSFAGMKMRFMGMSDDTHAPTQVAFSIDGALDSEGNWFPLSSCEIQEFDKADGSLDYVLAKLGGTTWKQTMTYSVIPGEPARKTGQWVKQP